MRLEELELAEFKNLRNFAIKFDESPHTVLVGCNGSGKSNLLESLLSLFSELHREEVAPFSYRVKYTCGGDSVEITATKGEYPACSVNGKSMPRNRFYAQTKQGQSRYLPRFVFGY